MTVVAYCETQTEFMNHFHHSICYKVHNTVFLQLTTAKIWEDNGLFVPYSKVGETGPSGPHDSCFNHRCISKHESRCNNKLFYTNEQFLLLSRAK